MHACRWQSAASWVYLHLAAILSMRADGSQQPVGYIFHLAAILWMRADGGQQPVGYIFL